MLIIHALQSILSIMLMIGIGYFLTNKGWFDDKISKMFSKVVIYVSLPALMISNLMRTFDKQALMIAKTGLVFPLGAITLSYGLSIGIARLLKVPKGRKGIFQAMFALSNTIFIGLPVNLALFGDQSVPYVMMYYVANTTFFWTIGVYCVRQDSNVGKTPIFTRHAIRKILSPPLIAFLIGVFLILLEVPLPKFIMDTSRYLGNLTTPLSMFFMGITIHGMKIKEIRLDREIGMILAGRFIFSPILAFALIYPFAMPDLMKKVFIMESAMPAIAQLAIIAQAYKADYQYATLMLSITTLAGLAAIPIYSILLSLL